VVADHGDFSSQFRQCLGRGPLNAQSHAHRAGDADGHCAAYDHVADDSGHLFVVGGENVRLFEGELGLIEEVDAFGRPFEGRNHPSYFIAL